MEKSKLIMTVLEHMCDLLERNDFLKMYRYVCLWICSGRNCEKWPWVSKFFV